MKSNYKYYLILCVFIAMICRLYGTGVYHLDLIRESAIILPSLAMGSFGLYRFLNQSTIEIETIESLKVEDINIIDRHAVSNYSMLSSRISDYLLYACMFAPLAICFDKNISPELTEIAFITGETYLLAFATVLFTKTTFQRIRPLAYNESVEMSKRQAQDARYAFISGHTALAFAGTILAARMYDEFYHSGSSFWTYTSAVTLASTVGFLRYKAGKHFPTDVLVGAAVGTGCALLLTQLHILGATSEVTNIPVIGFSLDF